jgi:uncharacterized protein (DUF1684 family)
MTAPDESFDISIDELTQEVTAYRLVRARRLTSERGWLTIIGKVWLSEGGNRMGSAAGSEILLPPERAPPFVGTVTLQGGVVRLVVDPSVEVLARGHRVTSLDLRSDADGQPDDIVIGSLTVQLLQRDDDFAIRVRDVNSPLRLSFAGVPAYPITPAWHIVARLEPYAADKQVIYEDSDGRRQVYLSPGLAVFEKDGITCRVEPVFESDRTRLFVLFADATNRDATYGAGRFLYVPLPERGRAVLDFNKAFNPPCAFTPFAACPVPPGGNRLPIRVEAGEMRPSG